MLMLAPVLARGIILYKILGRHRRPPTPRATFVKRIVHDRGTRMPDGRAGVPCAAGGRALRKP